MLIRRIKSCLTVASFCLKNIRPFCFYDKNFDSFRNKAEYRNLVVQPVPDVGKYRASVTAELPLAKKGDDTQMDGFFYHLMQRENVMKLSSSQVKDVLGVLANSKFDAAKYASILKYLDEKCALSAERWPLDLSFFILDAWLIILGPKAFRKHYYSAITSQWSRKIKKCSKSNLILVLYFIGMSKSVQPFLMDSVIDRMENVMSEFSDEEIAIACLSFFKCSKRVKSVPFMQRSCEAAEHLLQNNDQFNAVSVLKFLRLSKYHNVQLYKHVEDYVMKNHSAFNLVVCTNFLALFATQNIYSKELYAVLEAQAVSALNDEEDDGTSTESLKTHPSLRSRVKDLARLLWALTTVGHPVKEDTLTSVTSCIERRLQLGEYESQLPVLIDTLQSFVLADHYPANIFSPALSSSTFKRVYNCDKAKPKYQLYFVERSVAIEHPEISVHSSKITHSIPKHLENEIKGRQGFKELVTFLNQNFSVSLKRCYIMPHIMIAGIFFSKPNTSSSKSLGDAQKQILDGVVAKQVQDMIKNNHEYFCIEILDSSVCAGENNQPIGLMQAKIRQLKKLNFKVIALSTDEIGKIVEANVSKNCDIGEFFQHNLV